MSSVTTFAIMNRILVATKLGIDTVSIPDEYPCYQILSDQMTYDLIGAPDAIWEGNTVKISFFDKRDFRYTKLTEWCRNHLGDEFVSEIDWGARVFLFEFRSEAAAIAFKLSFLS